jgi:hypothetical protein
MKLFVPVTSASEISDSLIQLLTLNTVETVDDLQYKVMNTAGFMKNYVHVQTFLKNSAVYIVGVCEPYMNINDAESTQFTLFVVNRIECSMRCFMMGFVEYEKVQTTGET